VSRSLRLEGKLGEAEAEFDRSLALHPNWDIALKWKAIMAAHRGPKPPLRQVKLPIRPPRRRLRQLKPPLRRPKRPPWQLGPLTRWPVNRSRPRPPDWASNTAMRSALGLNGRGRFFWVSDQVALLARSGRRLSTLRARPERLLVGLALSVAFGGEPGTASDPSQSSPRSAPLRNLEGPGAGANATSARAPLADGERVD
jgi:hypothetical protein